MIGLHEDVEEMFGRLAVGIDKEDMLEGYGPVGYRDLEASKGERWLRANGHETVGSDHGDRLARASDANRAKDVSSRQRYYQTPAGMAARARALLKRKADRAARVAA